MIILHTLFVYSNISLVTIGTIKNKIQFSFLHVEVTLRSLLADDKGIIEYAKAVVNVDSTKTKIIADILFLFLQLIESFPASIVCYVKSIMVNEVE